MSPLGVKGCAPYYSVKAVCAQYVRLFCACHLMLLITWWLLDTCALLRSPRDTSERLTFVGAISQQTSCKCGHPHNSQADIFLQRFHLLGRCLPVSPVCPQILPHSREWKFDDTIGGQCMKQQEAAMKERTCRHMHSTLPMVVSGKCTLGLIQS